jgi:hypothetical protein
LKDSSEQIFLWVEVFESEDKFKESAQIFLHEQVEVTHVDLE